VAVMNSQNDHVIQGYKAVPTGMVGDVCPR
jgi:hypothetical protein